MVQGGGMLIAEGVAMDWQDWKKRTAQMPSIKKRLASALEDARMRHEQAKLVFDAARLKACGIGLDRIERASALRKATASYSDSLSQYKEALGRFCDFILRGRIPPEEVGEKL